MSGFGRPSQPHRSLPLGPERLSGSAARYERVAQLTCLKSQAQQARVVSCGATKRPPFSLLLRHIRLIHGAHGGERLVRVRVRARVRARAWARVRARGLRVSGEGPGSGSGSG